MIFCDGLQGYLLEWEKMIDIMREFLGGYESKDIDRFSKDNFESSWWKIWLKMSKEGLASEWLKLKTSLRD